MFATLFAAVIGALTNRYRGGGLNWLLKYLRGQRLKYSLRDEINALVFGVFMFLVSGNVWVGLACIAAMWLGENPGWGRYVSAVRDFTERDRQEPLIENRFIDWALVWAEPETNWKGETKHSAVLWGVAGLTLRGVYWGALLSIATLQAWPVLAGASMGVVYWATMRASKRLGADYKEQWHWSEYVFGAVLWVGCVQ